MTTDYQRGYNKGRASILKGRDSRAERLIRAIRELKARLDPWSPPRCDRCINWTRERECQWGYCRATAAIIGTQFPWFSPADNPQDERIVTTEDFGCVKFVPHRTPVIGGIGVSRE